MNSILRWCYTLFNPWNVSSKELKWYQAKSATMKVKNIQIQQQWAKEKVTTAEITVKTTDLLNGAFPVGELRAVTFLWFFSHSFYRFLYRPPCPKTTAGLTALQSAFADQREKLTFCWWNRMCTTRLKEYNIFVLLITCKCLIILEKR